MASLLMDPTPFLVSHSGRSFRFGETDCGLFLADYVSWARRLNGDLAEELRGTYDDEASCVALLRRSGGLLRLVARIAREARLDRVSGSDYPAGCIAVVRHCRKGGRPTHFGAVRAVGDRWALKVNHRLFFTDRVRVAAAWTV